MRTIPLKIGLTGTHSAGKTTLAHLVQEAMEMRQGKRRILPQIEVHTNLIRTLADEMKLTKCDDLMEDREWMRYFQQAALVRYLDQSKRIQFSIDPLASHIFDRTLIDIRAYLIGYERMFEGRSLDLAEEPLDQNELRMLLYAARFCTWYYDVIAYVCPIVTDQEEMEQEYTDEFRPTDFQLRAFIGGVCMGMVEEIKKFTESSRLARPVVGNIETTDQADRRLLLISMIEDAYLMEQLEQEI